MMKTLRLLFLALLFLDANLALGQAVIGPQGQYDLQKNWVTNPGFENGKGKWTSTGSATFTINQTNGADLLEGAATAIWDPSATGAKLTNTFYNLSDGEGFLFFDGFNTCIFQFAVKGLTNNQITAKVINSTGTVASKLLNNTNSNWDIERLRFDCGDIQDDVVAVEFESSGNAGAMKIDRLFMGHYPYATLAGTEQLSNKTIEGGTLSNNTITSATFSNGFLNKSGTAFYQTWTAGNDTTLTNNRSLGFILNDGNRLINLTGDFLTVGGNSLTLTTTGTTDVTLPTSGTLTTTAGPITNATVSVNDTDSLFALGLSSTSTLTSGKTLTFDVNDGNRTLEMSGNLIKSGADPLSLITSGTTAATYPTGTITLFDTTSSQTATNKTFTSPILNTPTLNQATVNLDDTDSSQQLQLRSTSSNTIDRTLTFDVDDGDRTLRMGANANIGVQFNTAGTGQLTFNTTGTANPIVPSTNATLLTTTDTQAVSNKDIDGGTASNSNRITLPKASTSTLNSLTRKEATVVYDTTSQKPYYDNGSVLIPIGSTTSLENNYITNGGAEEVATPTAWTTYDDGAIAVPVDGTGGSPSGISAIARTTTAGELIYGAGTWKLAKNGTNGQGEGWAYDFTLAPKSQLYSSLVDLRFDFYVTANYASGDVRVYVYDKDLATVIAPAYVSCGGGTTPDLSKSLTACHAQLAWLSTTSDDYRLVIHTATTNASAWDLFVDNLYVGERITAVGAAVGGWETYTPTGTWTTNTTYVGRKRRVGDSMEYEVSVQLSGAPNAVALSISQPSGETIDSTKIVDTSRGRLGDVTVFDVDGANTGRLIGELVYGNTGSSDVYVIDDASGSSHYNVTVTNTIPVTFASGDRVVIKYKAPIAQFAGTTASFGENNVEYAYNSGTWDAADSTSFAYGPGGRAMGGALTAARTKRVRFLTPISATDVISVQVSEDGSIWQDADGGAVNGSTIILTNDSTLSTNLSSGVAWVKVSGSTTDIDVIFRRYAAIANDDSPLADWPSSNAFWRVVKHKAGIPVGFAIATETNAGLLSPNAQTIGGAKTLTSELTTKVNHTDLSTTASTDTTNSLLRSGLFTWNGAGVTNVAALSSASRPMMWSLNGKVVSAAGSVSIQCTSGADADTQFTMTLPITPTSNFSTQEELMGTGMFIATHPSANNRPVAIYATSSAKTATFRFTCSSAAAGRELIYQFMYRIN